MNAGYIWTGQALKKQKLSECRLHLDRASPKKAEAVRIPVSFGQGKLQKSKSCQNAGLIRTGQARTKQKLSEYRLHSDKASPKKVEAV